MELAGYYRLGVLDPALGCARQVIWHGLQVHIRDGDWTYLCGVRQASTSANTSLCLWLVLNDPVHRPIRLGLNAVHTTWTEHEE